jgi:large subunit ribosomal protein L22
MGSSFMEIRASLRNLRIAPRKVRLVTNLVQGLNVEKAIQQLTFLTKESAEPIRKLIQSAVANAKEKELDRSRLYIKSITANEGTVLDRWMPRAMGRATPIRKRSTHVHVILDERPLPATKTPKSKKGSEKKESAKKPLSSPPPAKQ